MSRGFPPVASAHARVLILGSMPGRMSLEKREYYAHSRNVFWRLMGEMFEAGPELDYRERLAVLSSAGVALWDVLATCDRVGSLDSRIVMSSARANDFDGFFRRHSAIRRVFFNGAKAADLFDRLVRRKGLAAAGSLVFETLPSTSPAHAGLALSGKRRAWAAVKRALDGAIDADGSPA